MPFPAPVVTAVRSVSLSISPLSMSLCPDVLQTHNVHDAHQLVVPSRETMNHVESRGEVCTEATFVTDDQRSLSILERELTLLARHHLSTQQSRPGQYLERSAYLLLNRLEAAESMSLREIAEAFGLNVSTINRQVAPLLDRGLLERFPDPSGGMARRLRPTEKGLARLAADRERSREGVRIVVSEWPREQLESLVDLLTRFNIDVEELEGRPWPRTSGDAGDTPE